MGPGKPKDLSQSLKDLRIVCLITGVNHSFTHILHPPAHTQPP